MISLTKYLNSKGIEKEEDLTVEEKEVFDRYKRVLSGENLTVETIKEFCQQQIRVIEDKFASSCGTYDNDVYLKACLHVYLNILKAIEAPEAEREALERHLNSLI